MERPNFDRFIGMLMGDDLDYPLNVEKIEKRKDGIVKDWEIDWEEIRDGVILWPENPRLKDLLNKYHLLDFINDFHLLGYIISERINESWDYHKECERDDQFDKELHEVLYLLSNSIGDMRIKFIGRRRQVQIENCEMIEIIKESLFFHLINCTDHKIRGFPALEDKQKWNDYYTRVLNAHKVNSKLLGRGRKENNPEYKKITNWLRRYLEYNTHLKTEPGKFYSNEQAKFIFEFLEIYGLLKEYDLTSNKADVIGHYLKSEKKDKEKWIKYDQNIKDYYGGNQKID